MKLIKIIVLVFSVITLISCSNDTDIDTDSTKTVNTFFDTQNIINI
jgi:hypothetical protein